MNTRLGDRTGRTSSSSFTRVKHSIPRLVALLMALALGAAACGSSDSSDAAAPAAVDAGSGDAAPSSILDISAEAADGTTVNLSDYAGQDLMLWFWAPW